MGKVANMPPQNLKYVMHCRQRRTEPQPQLTRTEIFIKFGRVVFEICEWTDRQTDRQTCSLQYFYTGTKIFMIEIYCSQSRLQCSGVK